MTDSNGHSLVVADYWDKRGETYGRSWRSVAKKHLSTWELNLVKQAFKNKKKTIKTLDIGIGTGRVSDEIIRHRVTHYATDISQAMIDYNRKKYRNSKRVKILKVHDILNPLPKNWNEFDLVTAYRVLSYYPQLKTILKNIRRSMNDGGILIFTYPNINSSVAISRFINHQGWLGSEIGYNELRKIVSDAGFSECRIVGCSRLLDVFYDWSDSHLTANLLFGIEKVLALIFGPTRFVRLFYIICKK